MYIHCSSTFLICVFLFYNGIPAMKEIGFLNFLTGTTWKPKNDVYGILPMILGSIYVTIGAIIIEYLLEYLQQYLWQGFVLRNFIK